MAGASRREALRITTGPLAPSLGDQGVNHVIVVGHVPPSEATCRRARPATCGYHVAERLAWSPSASFAATDDDDDEDDDPAVCCCCCGCHCLCAPALSAPARETPALARTARSALALFGSKTPSAEARRSPSAVKCAAPFLKTRDPSFSLLCALLPPPPFVWTAFDAPSRARIARALRSRRLRVRRLPGSALNCGRWLP